MKYISTFLILIFIACHLLAQKQEVKNNPNYDKKPIHFGFTVGLNTMDFTINNSDYFLNTDSIRTIYSIQNERTPGFHLGPISNFRINDNLDLRLLINFSFGQRNLQYLILDTIQGVPTLRTHTMKLSSTYMEFPILIKYKSDRLNNYRPYLIAGITPKLDLAARKKIKDDEMPKIRLQPFDICFDVGFGLDIYLPYFKFSIELKFSAGFKDIIERDNTEYTSSIARLNSKMFMLSFHFE